MKQPVMIKAANNGITVVLDSEMDFRDLAIKVCEKFNESRGFLGASRLKLSLEGRKLTSDEVNKIISCIEANSDLYITYYEESDSVLKRKDLGLEERLTVQEISEQAQIIVGHVFDGQSIEADKSLVIIGDVKAGGSVSAKGNIIVTGQISGSVKAGYPNNRNAYIYAMAYDAQICRIGDVSGTVNGADKKRKGLFSKKDYTSGVAIALIDGELIEEPAQGGLIKKMQEIQ